MKPKTFDCIEMKRKASLRIYEETKDMSFEQEVAYWQQKSDEFLRKQEERKSGQDPVIQVLNMNKNRQIQLTGDKHMA